MRDAVASIGQTATTLDPYEAESRKRPLRSVEIQHMLAGNGALPTSLEPAVAGSMARLRTRYGSLRIDAYSTRRSGRTASGITAPPVANRPTSASAPSAPSARIAMSWLSALAT